MTLALVAMSHSPLLELSQPPAELAADVETAFDAARKFIAEYDPELVVVFGPDHYNGFFYELMPQFCIGLAATSIGDFGSTPGPLDVPRDIAAGPGPGRAGRRGRSGGVAADGGRPRHGATAGDPLRRADRGAGGAVLHQLRRPAVHPGAPGPGPRRGPRAATCPAWTSGCCSSAPAGCPTNRRCRPWKPRRAHVVEGLIAGRHPTAEATAKRRANVHRCREAVRRRRGQPQGAEPGLGQHLPGPAGRERPGRDRRVHQRLDQGTRRAVRAGDPQLDRRLRRAVHRRPVRHHLPLLPAHPGIHRRVQRHHRTPAHHRLTDTRTKGPPATWTNPSTGCWNRNHHPGPSSPPRRPLHPISPILTPTCCGSSTSHGRKVSSLCSPWVSTTGGDPAGKRVADLDSVPRTRTTPVDSAQQSPSRIRCWISTIKPHPGVVGTTEHRHRCSADTRAGLRLTVQRGSDAWPSQEHRRAADHGQKPDDADDQAGCQ